MNKCDILAVIGWFRKWIGNKLEYSPHYPNIQAGVNKLRGFVEVLERELYELS